MSRKTERYTAEELQEVLRLHALWLKDEEGGVRANLWRANLRGANLERANLESANLVRANLWGANLRGANLWGANLESANLVRANLWGANLVRANLWGANLVRANLWGAKNFSKVVTVGPIGSRNDATQYFLAEDKVVCGCFLGTLEEFEVKVKKTHAENPLHLAEYLAAIAMFKAIREAQPVTGEATQAEEGGEA